MTPKQALEAAIDACETAKLIAEKWDAEGKGFHPETETRQEYRAYKHLAQSIAVHGRDLKWDLEWFFQNTGERAALALDKAKENADRDIKRANEAVESAGKYLREVQERGEVGEAWLTE